MKYPSILFILLFLAFACNNDLEMIEQKDDSGNVVEKYKRNKKDLSKQGEYKKFFPKGALEELAYYKDDLLEGRRILFYESGDTAVVENYKMGKFEGEYRSFAAGNILKANGYYSNNAMNGKWNYYYDNKQLKEEVHFEINEENGPFMEYHENGKLKAKGNYKTTAENIDGNREHGLLELFDENGELYKKMNCNLGLCRTSWLRDSTEIQN